MSHPNNNPAASAKDLQLQQLRAAAEILERAAADRSLLDSLTVAERARLLKAAGYVYCPDVHASRGLVKATVRRRKAEKTQRDQSVLDQTGIRALRRKKVFTTPNVLPPPNADPKDVADPEFREVVTP